jgi:O-antigen/teichoic acid export membrane protein
MSSLKKLAIRGAIWTFAGYGTSQILRFANNLILTRLLVPEFFGLMALANTLRIGLELFTDIGIGQSIVQNKQGDNPVFYNTAWTVQVIRGIGIWVVCLLLTWPLAKFYGDDRLLLLLPIVALSCVFDGFNSTAHFTLHRRMMLGRLTIFEIIAQILGLAGMIIWAYFSPDIWALSLGGFGGIIFKMVGSYWLVPDIRHKFTWNKEALAEIQSFGRWIFLATMLMFLAEQSDRLILGKLLTFQSLGVYTIAYTLANIPREIIKQVSHRVIFPAISQQAELPRTSLREKILRQRWRLLMLSAVGVSLLIASGDMIIHRLYDQRYQEATWMMPILCSGIWFSVLFYTMSPALLAIGKPLYSAQSNLARLVVIGFGLPIAYFLKGILGAVLLIACSDFFPYLVLLHGLSKERLTCITQDLQTTAFFIGFLTLVLFIRSSIGLGLPIHGV